MSPWKEQEINTNFLPPWSIKTRLTKIISFLLIHPVTIVLCQKRVNL